MKTVKCIECKEEKQHYAKCMCQECYNRVNQRRYYKENIGMIREKKKAMRQKKKKEQALFNKRIKRALRKLGESEKRIVEFYGVK